MERVKVIDQAVRHLDAGSWEAAARPLAVFLRWAVQRGLAAPPVQGASSEPADAQGRDPWVRHVLERLDGKLTTEELDGSAGVFALAIWDAHLEALAADEGAHDRWLDDRWAEHCAALGEPIAPAAISTQEAVVTLLKDAAFVPHRIPLEHVDRVAEALTRDPVGAHVFDQTPPRSTEGRARPRFVVGPSEGARFGGTAWSEVAADTSPLDVDLDELIEIFGAAAAAAWLADALTRAPGAQQLDPSLRGETLRALVWAQLAVRILEPGSGPFPQNAVVSLGDHGRAVGRVLAAGGQPPIGDLRMVSLVRALHVQVPFEGRGWAAQPMFASALRRAERWFPDADLPAQDRLLTALLAGELAAFGQSPLTATGAATIRLLRRDEMEGTAVVAVATVGQRPALEVTERSSEGALRTHRASCDADALRSAFHALPRATSRAHDGSTFLVELREGTSHHVRLPEARDVEMLARRLLRS